MKNLNKFRLAFNGQFAIIADSTGGNKPTFFNSLSRIANDLPRPLKIVGINIAFAVLAQTLSINRPFSILLSLGTTNKYDINTNIFEWIQTAEMLTTVQGQLISVYNGTIGNFQDEIFTLEPFKTETQGGNAPKGEIFMNAIGRDFANAGSTLFLDAVIYLYYK